jgi:putative ABC transport system ATP-binding protein
MRLGKRAAQWTTDMLRLRGLAKSYGATPVFEGVDLDVGPGQVVAILGESGVGKSTLLNGIAGLDPLDGGSVSLDGAGIDTLDERAMAHWRRANVGFVFQAFHVLPHLTVHDNVALPLLLLGRPAPDRVREMLTAVGLETLQARMPRTLSGGQLQRVAIARALVHGPRIVLADEPTGNLDPATAARVLELLVAQVRARGAAAVLVTHSEAAASRADRVVRLTATGIVSPGRPLPPALSPGSGGEGEAP